MVCIRIETVLNICVIEMAAFKNWTNIVFRFQHENGSKHSKQFITQKCIMLDYFSYHVAKL